MRNIKNTIVRTMEMIVKTVIDKYSTKGIQIY